MNKVLSIFEFKVYKILKANLLVIYIEVNELNEFLYLDNAATTSVSNEVLNAMIPYFSTYFGNASSQHFLGKISKEAIEISREKISNLLNCYPNEIIFTSGATESINLAIKGFVEYNFDKGNHIITLKTEHKAVLATCEYLETRGVDVTYLDVDSNGIVSLEAIENSIRNDTILISVMYVNNEIGVIQPIDSILKIAKKYNIAFFTDATQAIGKVGIDLKKNNIDLLAFSGHKINGPKGIGVLYIKQGINITPQIHGGNQERGYRSGTYNTPFIVGIGKACEIAFFDFKKNQKEALIKSNIIIQQLKKIKGVVIIAENTEKIPHIINASIPGIDSDFFVSSRKKVAISNGSACNSMIVSNSHVLKSLNLGDDFISSCVRISFNSDTKIEKLLDLIKVLGIC